MNIFIIFISILFSVSSFSDSNTKGNSKTFDKNMLIGFPSEKPGPSVDDKQQDLDSTRVMAITGGTMAVTGAIVGGAIAYKKNKKPIQDKQKQEINVKFRKVENGKMAIQSGEVTQSMTLVSSSTQFDPKIKQKEELKEQLRNVIKEYKDSAQKEEGSYKTVRHLEEYQKHIEKMIDAKDQGQFMLMGTTIPTKFESIEGIHNNVHHEVKRITREAERLL